MSSGREERENRKRSREDSESEDDSTHVATEHLTVADYNIKPKVGMRVELLDVDHIWNPTSVVKVEKQGKDTFVTIRFDGWGSSWDERMRWTEPRLAPIYTFTKRVKCLVELFSPNLKKSKVPQRLLDELPKGANKTYSVLWPCRVHFRMPHPFVDGEDDEEKCLYAEEFLRAEKNVSVQPYGLVLLPQYIQESFDTDDGRWFAMTRLRCWREDPSVLGVLPENFLIAFQIANADQETPGVLPSGAIEKGSLLKDVYRVHDREGAAVRDGALVVSELPVRLTDEGTEPIMQPPEEVQIKEEENEEDTSDSEDLADYAYVPPASTPPAIQITDMIYPGCGVKRCKNSNNYVASITLGGNEIFLGSFPTQTQAYQATRIAAGVQGIKIEKDLRKARLADLQALPLESIIDAAEERDPEIHTFSVHDWILNHVARHVYLRKSEGEMLSLSPLETDSISLGFIMNAGSGGKSKRKGTPRKVDLVKRCYIDS